MHIDITGLDETEVEAITTMFESWGLEYDTDFTTLYGKEWAITGVRLITPRAITAGAGLVMEVAV